MITSNGRHCSRVTFSADRLEGKHSGAPGGDQVHVPELGPRLWHLCVALDHTVRSRTQIVSTTDVTESPRNLL